MLYLTRLAGDCSRVLAVGSVVLALVWSSGALSHEMIGSFMNHGGSEYLYGQRIGSPLGGRVNCCLHKDANGRVGDCREYTGKVRIVPGGYELEDGTRIEHHDTSVSPQDVDGESRYWICQHEGALPHCWFAPAAGS